MNSRELRDLVAALESEGFTVRRTTKGHLRVLDSTGRPVATLSGTPSDHRSWRNGISQLRRAGFRWPRE